MLFNPCDAPKLQCLGIPFISVDARVIDIDTGAEVTTGEQGEIIVHGPQLFHGYWNNPEATELAFITVGGKQLSAHGRSGLPGSGRLLLHYRSCEAND